jgi:hypothetical protein
MTRDDVEPFKQLFVVMAQRMAVPEEKLSGAGSYFLAFQEEDPAIPFECVKTAGLELTRATGATFFPTAPDWLTRAKELQRTTQLASAQRQLTAHKDDNSPHCHDCSDTSWAPLPDTIDPRTGIAVGSVTRCGCVETNPKLQTERLMRQARHAGRQS